jgi:hypothetical protein
MSNQIITIENRIEKLEKQIATMDSLISNPSENMKSSYNPGFYEEYEILKKKLTEEMWNWEKCHQELEAIKNKRN